MNRFDQAFVDQISATVNLTLVQSFQQFGPHLSILQAQANALGTVEFLKREMGAEAAYEFFARIADGIVQSIPQTEKAHGTTTERKDGGSNGRNGGASRETGEGKPQGKG